MRSSRRSASSELVRVVCVGRRQTGLWRERKIRSETRPHDRITDHKTEDAQRPTLINPFQLSSIRARVGIRDAGAVWMCF